MCLKILLIFTLLSVGDSQRIRRLCGLSGKSSGLIFGGKIADVKSWPWLGVIYDSQSDQYLCGASLVGSNIAITAAHCIQEKGNSFQRQPNEIIVKLGKRDLSKRYERGTVVAFPSEIIIHPSWKYFTEIYDSDIAIIIFEVPVQFTTSIFPVCLWNEPDDPTEMSGFIVGYGKTDNKLLFNLPRELQVEVQTNEDCFLKNHQMALISSKNTFCASSDSHSGPCHGDSGGGLFFKHKSRWYLRGITSTSLMSNSECDLRNDAVFTNVIKFSKWIREIVSAKLETPQKFLSKKRPKKEIICYMYGGSEPKPDGFKVEELDLDYCTILVYIFIGIDGDELMPFNPERELLEGNENSFKKFTSLKKKHSHLLTLLAVGGWSTGSVKFSQLSADPDRRKRFAVNAAKFLKKYDFDGLEIYWEYPTERGGTRDDKNNLVELLRELNGVFDFEDLYLTAALRTLAWLVPNAYDIKNIVKYVNHISMMTFGYTGYWGGKVGFTSPLQSDNKYNIIHDVEEFIKLGAPPEKLILGLPFHGRSFVTNNTGNIGDFSFSYEDGISLYQKFEHISYSKICKLRKQTSWEEIYDKTAAQIIGKYTLSDGRKHVTTFDSPRSTALKVKYAMEMNLGGVWTGWSVGMDDFRGDCENDLTVFSDFPHAKVPTRTAKDFPLLRTINETMELTKYLWKC